MVSGVWCTPGRLSWLFRHAAFYSAALAPARVSNMFVPIIVLCLFLSKGLLCLTVGKLAALLVIPTAINV